MPVEEGNADRSSARLADDSRGQHPELPLPDVERVVALAVTTGLQGGDEYVGADLAVLAVAAVLAPERAVNPLTVVFGGPRCAQLCQ